MKVTGGFRKLQVRGHGRSLGTPQDPNRLVRRGSGAESVEVLGYSPSARRVLLVWIYTTGHPPTGCGRAAARSPRPQGAGSVLGRARR
jgi:hypothetical protein